MPINWINVFDADRNELTFHLLLKSEHITSIASSVIVDSQLNMKVIFEKQDLTYCDSLYRRVQSLLSENNKIKSFTEICNVLALVKSFHEEVNIDINFLSMSKNYLLKHLQSDKNDGQYDALLNFILNQLTLIEKKKQARRYCADMLVLSFLWYSCSTACYKKLQNLFILPSVRRLKQLSEGFFPSQGEVDMSYLTTRVQHLQTEERNVILLIDEVYLSSKLEFRNGEMLGVTEDGTVAKTILSFMVRSIAGKYQDVVALYAVEKLNTEKLYNVFMHVLKQISICNLYSLHGVSVDNHAVNRGSLLQTLWYRF